MFGRGNWAIVGLVKESHAAFERNLEDRRLMLAVSQLAASAVTRNIKLDAMGINPFSAPRLDEQHALDADRDGELAKFAALEPNERPDYGLASELLEVEGYGYGNEQFQVNPTLPWYGLWAVSNQWKDVSDLASIKEQHSYAALDRPYRFLQATDKKTVDQETQGVTAAVRKQFAVLLDFNEGRMYLETSSKKAIQAVTEFLKQLGAEFVAVGWSYNRADWPAAILNKLHEDTHFQDDFIRRADEATRFHSKEIEKLEDKEVESIVANYFAMTELPGDLWAGLSTPAQIRLHTTGQPIGVRAPMSATTLLGMTSDAHLVSASITFQERISYLSKKGEARTFRKDVFSIDVNDQINLTDAGAAMLRGFDIPSFRKDLQREIRKTKQVPSIEQFWSSWLLELTNAVRTIETSFREALGLDGDAKVGILPMHVSDAEEVPELEIA